MASTVKRWEQRMRIDLFGFHLGLYCPSAIEEICTGCSHDGLSRTLFTGKNERQRSGANLQQESCLLSTFVGEENAEEAGEPAQERIAVGLLLIPPELYRVLNEEAVSKREDVSRGSFRARLPSDARCIKDPLWRG